MRSSFLALCSVLFLSSALNAQIALTSGTYTQNFDAIGAGLPTGWSVYTSSTISSLGTAATFTSAATAWNVATLGTDFRNIAGNTIATNASTVTQAAASNRAVGWRPVGTNSSEVTPGRNGSLVATFANTTGLTLASVTVLMFTSNDVSGSQSYVLEYRVGDTGNFTPAAVAYNSDIPFAASTLSANSTALAALSNQTGPIYIRIRGTATSGASNLDTVGIDNFTVVAQTSQSITFGALPARTFGDAPSTVTATASSGLTPVFSIVSGPASISGSTVTLSGAGTVTVRASQSGDSTFAAAPDVDQTFTVNKATATVSVGAQTATYDGAGHAATATTTPASLATTFSYVATSGTIYGPSAAPPVNAGTYAVTATINDADYQGTGTGTLTIGKAPATVVLGSVPATYDGLPHFATATTNPAGISIAYTYNGSTAPPVNAGTYNVVATINHQNYTGAATGTLVITPASGTVTLGSVATIYNGTPRAATATTSPAGKIVDLSYSGTGATIYGPSSTPPTDAGTYSVTASINDLNYSGANSATLTITPAPQTITFNRPPDHVINDAPFTLNATSSSGLPVAFQLVSGSPEIATLSGNTISLAGGAGAATIRATQAGSSNYLAAPSVDQTFNVVASAIAPRIEAQPDDHAGYPGENFVLSVTVSGYPAPTFQWEKDFVAIPGATSATLAFTNLSATDSAVYDLIATNAAGTAKSRYIGVTVAPREQTITFAPPVTTLAAGSTLTLSATSSAGLPVSFVIRSGTASLKGNQLTGTSGTVVIAATQAGDAGTNAATPVERTFVFVSGALSPFITSPPTDQTPVAGTTATLRVAAVGTPAPTYQWQKDGVALAGATDATLTLANVSVADSGRYAVTVTNFVGSATASATVTVRAAPAIAVAPAAATVAAGESASFIVTATGAPAPTFQWRKNGVAIAGATSATLTFARAATSDAGRYDVVATNLLGSVTSTAATLTVTTRNFSGTYFGTFTGAAAGARVNDFALLVRADGTAVFLGNVPALQTGFAALDLKVDQTGNFSSRTTTLAATIELSPTAAPFDIAAAAQAVTLSGALNDLTGEVTGSVPELGLSFGGTRASPSGSATAIAGLYQAALVGSAAGSGYVMIAPDGQAYALTTNGAAVDSARGVVGANGRLTLTTASQANIDLGFSSGAMTGTVRVGNVTTTIAGALSQLTGQERLVNLSVRATTAPGASALITGFVVSGTSAKQVLVRAAGPAIAVAPFNVAGALADPTLQILRGNQVVAQNDEWNTPAANTAAITAAATRVGAFPFRNGSADAAVLTTLAPGPYSVVVGGGTGTVLAEVYEVLDTTEVAGARRLVNLSARGIVAPVTPLIIGFVITGNAPQRVLVRGIGPTLGTAPFNVAGALPNPQLTIFRGTTAVKTNDDWFRDPDATVIRDATTKVGAFALPANSVDAAILIYLEPGAYTAQVSGPANANANNSTGIALVEVYEAAP